MDQVRDIFRLLNPIANLTKLNKIDQVKSIQSIEKSTGVKPSQIAVLVTIGLALYIASYFLRVSNIFVWFFCYFFPAYFTLIALRDNNQQVYTKYLVYWVFYPLFVQTQPIFIMLFNRTIFSIVRMVVTALFLSPRFDLGNRFYESVLRPFLENQQTRAVTGQIDAFVEQGGQKIQDLKKKIKKN